MTTSVKNNFLSPNLISNLQQVLATRNEGPSHNLVDSTKNSSSSSCSSLSGSDEGLKEGKCAKPVVLVTNADGIESSGLQLLVEALVLDGNLDVCVCAPQMDRSLSGHCVTVRETISVCSAEISGAVAYEVSGTPADCVSLALSGALFCWSRPALVISGINRGSSFGHNMLYSGAVAAAREALICGVPSLCISLNWKKDVSCESNMKEAVGVCLPLIHAAVKSVQNGVFPKSCLLNIEIPNSPLTNKGFKITRQSVEILFELARPTCCTHILRAMRPTVELIPFRPPHTSNIGGRVAELGSRPRNDTHSAQGIPRLSLPRPRPS